MLLVILVILLGISAWKYPGFLRKKTDGETSQNTPVINVPKDSETLSDVPEGLEWPFHSAAVDFEAAKRLGIDAFRALALPGKYAPKTAAEIIKSVVLDILRENKA